MTDDPPRLSLLLNVKGRLCVVIGGGIIAERRTHTLLNSGATVKLIAPEATDTLKELAAGLEIEWLEQGYSPKLIDGAFLIVVATNSKEVNRAANEEAKRRGILVNAADDADEGDFIIPSVIRRGALSISVSTGGGNPALSSHVSKRIDREFGPEWIEFSELLARLRDYLKEKMNAAERGRLTARFLENDFEWLERLKSEEFARVEEDARQWFGTHRSDL